MYERTNIKPSDEDDITDIAKLAEAVLVTTEIKRVIDSHHYVCALDLSSDSYLEYGGIWCVDHEELAE